MWSIDQTTANLLIEVSKRNNYKDFFLQQLYNLILTDFHLSQLNLSNTCFHKVHFMLHVVSWNAKSGQAMPIGLNCLPIKSLTAQVARQRLDFLYSSYHCFPLILFWINECRLIACRYSHYIFQDFLGIFFCNFVSRFSPSDDCYLTTWN